MKKTIFILMLTSVMLVSVSCSTQQSAVQQEEERRTLVENVENGRFTFNANYVIPMGNFKSQYLTGSYQVKVTRDTVYSHLPYFGVAYEAPWNPSESPLVFNSTDFTYSYEQGKRSGSWIVNVEMKDRIRPINYIFTIWENGSADLVVWDSSRQSISFRGEIENTSSKGK
ncbi:MAG: DUF4251 domain-containing protein [Paludibacteraceae bacterium]